jgi:hypothetical protein
MQCHGVRQHAAGMCRKLESPRRPRYQVRTRRSATRWEDPRVQIVYTLLCADEAPPDREEHWEGWIARRIVAALATKPAETPAAESDEWLRWDADVLKRNLDQLGAPTDIEGCLLSPWGRVEVLLKETQRSSNATRSDEQTSPSVQPPAPEPLTDAQIDAGWKHAEAYEGDDRQDIKTDVFNAFQAGIGWERRRTPAHPSHRGEPP